ncbi:MAG: tetratricopeptide repeat protein [Candidatus Omnitrophica bacterium]|nr:tetratricopeptide repeat protein [Candidatus Omnitrophota bacterium]
MSCRFAELDQRLQQTNSPTAITAVAGMGGVGKTELAIRYARSRLGAYHAGVCWVKARGTELATQVLAFAQDHLGLVPPETLQDAERRVGYCWARWPGQGRVLLILDDLADWNVIQPFLPTSDRFRILVTTRKTFIGVQPVPLDVLAPTYSFALLKSLAGAERCEAQRTDAERLCEWLGHLPLALELVGRYLGGKPDLTLCEMLSRLRGKGLDHPSTKRAEGMMTAERGVGAALELSWDELSQPQRELGCLLSLFALAPVPWEMAQRCFPDLDPEDLEDARDSGLLGASMLQRKGEGFYQLHKLVREFLRAKLELMPSAAGLNKAFVGALVAAARRIPQQTTLEIFSAYAPLIPHIEELSEERTEDLGEYDLLWPFVALQRLHEYQSLFFQAEACAAKALAASSRRFGPEHPNVALSLNNLAELYRDQGRYEEAEPLYTQALEIAEQTLGQSHPTTKTIRGNLNTLKNKPS